MNIKLLFFYVGMSSLCFAQEPSSASSEAFSWGASVDTYYAFDFNRPSLIDRSYTTQAARHNEFNVNLAFIEAQYHDESVRGRLALQAGTSVQANYSSEPKIGSYSGASLSQHIQEATIGLNISKPLWLDAGIYFSHIGAEGFISKNNLTYSRSLVSDYSPYYQTGVRLNYQPNETWNFQLHLVNGWQTISESNAAKTIGTQIAYQLSPSVSISYNTLLGEEEKFRHFHDLVLKWSCGNRYQGYLEYDLGFQEDSNNSKLRHWMGAAFVHKLMVRENIGLSARLEGYRDPHQVIVKTPNSKGFEVLGASVGIDWDLHSTVVWRNEVRALFSKDRVFPNQSSSFEAHDTSMISSLTFAFLK